MEGKSILGTEWYNSLFAALLTFVSSLSIYNGTEGKESLSDGTQMRTNFLVVHR